MPRALSGCSFIIVHKTPNKNRRQADHSLETCLCNNRVLVASLSIQNKVKKKIKTSHFHSYEFAVVHIHTGRSRWLHTFLLVLLAGHSWGHGDKQSAKRIHWGQALQSHTANYHLPGEYTESVSKAVLYGLAPYLALASPFLSAERDCK